MKRKGSVSLWVPAIALVTLVACWPTEQRTETMDAEALLDARATLSNEAAAALDSGGVAFRAGEYEQALERYRRAAELEPDAAAPWFGIYMAQRSLGDFAAADSALARAQSVAPGATLLQDTLS
jgi:Flp pilus assembly protein TadD